MNNSSSNILDNLQSSQILIPNLNSGTLTDPQRSGFGRASIISVNSTADVVDSNDGVTTLREAINFANTSADEDSIVFDSSLFASGQTITLSLGELNITHSLNITAPIDFVTGRQLVTISGNNASRVFEIGSGATINLFGLAIANGKVTNFRFS